MCMQVGVMLILLLLWLGLWAAHCMALSGSLSSGKQLQQPSCSVTSMYICRANTLTLCAIQHMSQRKALYIPLLALVPTSATVRPRGML